MVNEELKQQCAEEKPALSGKRRAGLIAALVLFAVSFAYYIYFLIDYYFDWGSFPIESCLDYYCLIAAAALLLAQTAIFLKNRRTGGVSTILAGIAFVLLAVYWVYSLYGLIRYPNGIPEPKGLFFFIYIALYANMAALFIASAVLAFCNKRFSITGKIASILFIVSTVTITILSALYYSSVLGRSFFSMINYLSFAALILFAVGLLLFNINYRTEKQEERQYSFGNRLMKGDK